jgi:hypothetical protein
MATVPPPATTHYVKIKQCPPTSWFDPIDITRTGLLTVLAGLFGSFADKREVLAALYPDDDKVATPVFDYSGEAEVWFDFISDTGDGWNPTYSIACLAGEDSLNVPPVEGTPVPPLPRGAFTILGGDQVYPVASAEEYRERMEGPFFAALATTSENEAERHPVYALPGNHDWYDGLTSFIRLFCQKDRWVGQWRATQTRSYFAIKLPHRWWVWGVDVQLESDLDPAQVRYFKHYASFLTPGDRVILVSPEPAWIKAGHGAEPQENQAHKNMEFIESKLIAATGATVPVKIAGDLHHYARYESADGKTQLITCGGGGAFLHGTYGLPQTLDLTRSTGQQFTQKKVAPTAEQSEGLCRSIFWNMLGRNPRFAFAIGMIYLVYSWFLQSASEALNPPSWSGGPLLEYFRNQACSADSIPCWHVVSAWWTIVLRDPLLFFFSVLIIGGCMAFAVGARRAGTSRFTHIIVGGLHGLAHIVLALAVIKVMAQVPLGLFTKGWVVHLAVLVAGAIPGTILMAAYLWISHKFFKGHDQEVLSAQAIEDYKCFARFHVTKDAMTIFPIGLETVCKRWTPAPGVTEVGSSRGRVTYAGRVPVGTRRIFEPAEPLTPRLMERPIVF